MSLSWIYYWKSFLRDKLTFFNPLYRSHGLKKLFLAHKIFAHTTEKPQIMNVTPSRHTVTLSFENFFLQVWSFIFITKDICLKVRQFLVLGYNHHFQFCALADKFWRRSRRRQFDILMTSYRSVAWCFTCQFVWQCVVTAIEMYDRKH